MKTFVSTATLAVVLLGASVAQAAIAATLKVGTLGIGADLTVGIDEKFNARVGVSGLSYGFSVGGDEDEEGSKSISPDLKLLTLGALLDWHPWAGGFRVSTGLYVNKNKLDLTADTSQKVEINDKEYLLSDLDGTVDFRSLAPYLGFGYGNALGADGRWHFACDFGVMFQGSPQVGLAATVNDPALQAQLDADLEQEAKKIEDDISFFRVYPVLTLGVSYRF